jgi:hypothetical protein
MTAHPLTQETVVREIERAAAEHLGRPWAAHRFTDLDERASHRCGILHGEGLSVFAKLDTTGDGDVQFTAEVRGHTLLRRQYSVSNSSRRLRPRRPINTPHMIRCVATSTGTRRIPRSHNYDSEVCRSTTTIQPRRSR